MKVLLTHRYFWPDTSPYGVIIRQLGEDLAGAGHDVRVFTSKPSYGKEEVDGPSIEMIGSLHVRRIWTPFKQKKNQYARLVSELVYSFALFFYVIVSRADVVTAGTFPPVIGAWSASLATKLIGAKFVYHVQDIHPEVSVLSGDGLGRGFSLRALRWLDNQTLLRASAIVTLSADMGNTLMARGLGVLPIHIINNPPLKAESIDPPAGLRKPDGKVRVIFAGNIGRFQNVLLLAEGVALSLDKHPELELMILGDGVALKELKERWGNHRQVRFVPFLPFSQAQTLIAEADVGLVSLSKGLYRVAYPSKVASYRALGLKILALIEPESELVKEIIATKCGTAPSNTTPLAISEALDVLLNAPAPNVKHSYKNQQSNLDLWPQLVSTLRKSD